MSVILVAEQDASTVRQIADSLRSEGWTARTVDSRAAAMASAAAETPNLVLASSTLPEAAQLLGAFARGRGGPGSVVLVPEADAAGVSAADYQADELLTKPCSDETLKETVRQCLGAGVAQPPPKRVSRQLTSAEIFGDVLAEVEAEALRARQVRSQSKAKRDDDIERRLEETLSGVLSVDEMRKKSKKKAIKTAGVEDHEIDALLDKTLSSLDMLPSAPPPAAARPPAPPPAAAARPEPRPAPRTAPPPALGEPIPALVPPPDLEPPAFEDAALASDEPPTMALEDLPVPPPPAAAEPFLERRAADRRAEDRRAEEPVLEASPAAAAPGRGSDVRLAPAAERDGEIFLTQPLPIVARKPAPGKDAADEPSDGTPFGDYTLLDRIALGGMAEVWRARRRGVEGFQKTVAIKKILAHLTDSKDFVAMLIDEAKLAAQLNHHNIIQIYDLGKVGSDFFIAMEYVEGKDLRSILNAAKDKDQPLPIGLTLLIVDAVARALDYAHRKRDFEDRELELVHRDVSPQNVLISYEGEIKLCDFGIVKAVSKASTTQMGALKGKLQYMSPEQAWGRSVDARSDIFSLGSVFFELLTGAKLFTGDSEISVLDAVRECQVKSPREIVPAVPREVESIVLKALAKNPEVRYQRAGDMEHDIKSVLDLIKPTPGLKDLASYMDGLFRRTAAAAPPPASGEAPAAGTAAPSSVVSASAVRARPATEASKIRTSSHRPPQAAAGGRRIGKLLAAAAVAGVLAGTGYFLLRGPLAGSAETAPAPPTVDETAAPEPAPAAGGEETAAGVPANPATVAGEPGVGDAEPAETGAEDAALPVDLEQLVAEEVLKRKQEMERDFEERKRRLQQEIEKTKKAAEEDGDGGG